MAEYIERDALMRYPIRSNHCDKEHANWNFILGIESVMEYAEHLPVADVAPVVHGEWLNADGDWAFATCSECGEGYDVSDGPCEESFGLFEKFYRFCPGCGAKMDKEGEND